MRPNGPLQTAQRLGVQCRAFRVKFGISLSSRLRASPSLFALQGSWIWFELWRDRSRLRHQSTAPQYIARLG